MSDAEWEAALNASDEYFYNESVATTPYRVVEVTEAVAPQEAGTVRSRPDQADAP